MFKRLCPFILVFTLGLNPAGASAADLQGLLGRNHDEVLYERAVALAKEKKLADAPYWEVLLHYKQGWFSGYRSLIDDPAFFLSPEGKKDKEAELLATIRQILTTGAEPDTHAQCRFPARTQWLLEELPILREKLPPAQCPRYEAITERIAPSKATLVFPFFNMDGPGSIFGHTMLRIERDNSAPLLGYAVTYAAEADGAGAMTYIVYGLAGGFDGRYTVLPYADKLNEYGAIESRDVWEYELEFSKDEVRRMYDHIWEMSLVLSDYYFFDENCAYNLLFFIEAARPGIKLTDGYVFVIPADTIKAISDAGLVSGINFRPSDVKSMERMASYLNSGEIALAKEIALDEKPVSAVPGLDISDEKKAALLDLSSGLVRNYNKRVGEQQLKIYQRLTVDILSQRAGYAVKNDYSVPKPAVSPDQGHDSTRVTLDGGYAYDSAYAQLGIRFGYHSLDDSAAGFLEGANATLGDIRLRYYTDSDAERFGLERFTIMDVHSLVPYTSLYKSISWMAGIGLDDRSVDSRHSFRVAYTNGGVGLTFEPTPGVMLWGAGTAEAQYQFKSPYEFTVGGGARAGVILNTGSFGKILLDGRYLWYADSSDHVEADLSAKYALYPARNHAITAKARYLRVYDKDGTDFGLSYRIFF